MKITPGYRPLLQSVIVSSLGPLLVVGAGYLLRLEALADVYFGFFKNAGFLVPVIVGLLLASIGALPGILILTDSFHRGRRVLASLTLVWALICFVLSLGLSGHA